MLQALLDEYKPMLDMLNDTGNRLTSLIQGPSAAEIADTVAKDNEKYDAINDLVHKRVEKINQQREKSHEVKLFLHSIAPQSLIVIKQQLLPGSFTCSFVYDNN